MGGFGDLLGGLAGLFGGGAEGAGESMVEGGLAALGLGDGDGDAAAAEQTGSVDRYLTGAPRALNINDI